MATPPSHWLLDRIGAQGETTFLLAAGGSWTYTQLADAAAASIVALEKHGVAPGEVVALVGDYGFESIALLVALIAHRTTIVPIAAAVEADVAKRIEISGATRVCWVEGNTACWSDRPKPDAPSQLLARLGGSGLILFSSGSTGEPKAMLHDLDRLLAGYQDRRRSSLVLLAFLMFDHIGGLNTLFTALASGATLVVPGLREPDAIGELIARHRVALLPTSPTFLNLFLLSEAAKRHDLGSLRIISYGTEPMPPGLLQRLRRAFPSVKFVQTFGTSETGITPTHSKSSDSTLIRLGDPGLETRVVDGELWLRSRTQILGYLNHPMDSFTSDGWFRTGDLVELAGDGYLQIVGRRSEVINVGGEKVLPAEVESVLLTLPGIADCVVRGEANPLTGQIVTAQVVLAPGADPAAIRKQVRIHCRGKLAAYKVPVKVEVVPQTAFTERHKKIRAATPVP